MIDLFLFDLVNIGYFLMLQCSSRCLKGFMMTTSTQFFPCFHRVSMTCFRQQTNFEKYSVTFQCTSFSSNRREILRKNCKIYRVWQKCHAQRLTCLINYAELL